MDHSVYGYLQRRTTQELTEILSGYLRDSLSDYEAEIVAIIREILEKRKE